MSLSDIIVDHIISLTYITVNRVSISVIIVNCASLSDIIVDLTLLFDAIKDISFDVVINCQLHLSDIRVDT